MDHVIPEGALDAEAICRRTEVLLRDALYLASQTLVPLFFDDHPEWRVTIHIPTLCMSSDNTQSQNARRIAATLFEDIDTINAISREEGDRPETVFARSMAANLFGSEGQAIQCQVGDNPDNTKTISFDDGGVLLNAPAAHFPLGEIRSGLATSAFLSLQIRANEDFAFPMSESEIMTLEGMPRFRKLIETQVFSASDADSNLANQGLGAQIAALGFVNLGAQRPGDVVTQRHWRTLLRVFAPIDGHDVVIR